MRAKDGVDAAEVDRRLALLALQEGDFEEAQTPLHLEMSRPRRQHETAAFYLAEIAALEGDKEHALAGYPPAVRLDGWRDSAHARGRHAARPRKERVEALTLLDDYVAEHPESAASSSR